MSNRADIADQLELIGDVMEIEEIVDVLGKFEKGDGIYKVNARVMKIEGILLRNNKTAADKLVAMANDKSIDEVDAMNDKDYTKALRDAILTEVLGFFA